MAAKTKSTKKKPPARRRILSTTELADEIGVTTRTVDNYRAEGCPVVAARGRNNHNRFDLELVRRWMLSRGRTGEHGGSRAEPGDAPASPNGIAAHRCRKEAATADLRELEVKLKKAQLVLRREVAAAGVAKTTVLRTRFLNLADTMPASLRGLDEQAIRGRMRAQFEQLCRDFGSGIDGAPPTIDDLDATARMLGLLEHGETLVVQPAAPGPAA